MDLNNVYIATIWKDISGLNADGKVAYFRLVSGKCAYFEIRSQYNILYNKSKQAKCFLITINRRSRRDTNP